jgi:hypothetical protein
MPSNRDSACPELLARIGQLEEETTRLQLLIAELVLKNQHLRGDIRAAGVPNRALEHRGPIEFLRTGDLGPLEMYVDAMNARQPDLNGYL